MAGLKITDSGWLVMMTGQIFFCPVNPDSGLSNNEYYIFFCPRNMELHWQ